MKKTVRKIFSVFMAVCLITSLMPGAAWALSADEEAFLNGVNMADDSTFVEEPGIENFGYEKPNASAITDVYGIAYDGNLAFTEIGPNRNFPSAADAVTGTAAGSADGPLYAIFAGSDTETAYTYTWTLDDATPDGNGGYTYTPHSFSGSAPTFTGPNGTSGQLNGSPVSINMTKDVRFDYSITSGDGLADNQLYRYTLTISDGTANHDPIKAEIMVSTMGDYEQLHLYKNEDAGSKNPNATSVQGIIYKSGLVVPALRGDSLPPSSPAYVAMQDAAASASTPQNITTPEQLAITYTNPKTDTSPAYMPGLVVRIGIPTGPDVPEELANLEPGDECTVYQYDNATNKVTAVTGKVVTQIGPDGNPIDGMLSVQINMSGTSASLGAFALGYPNAAGSFTVEAVATKGGNVSPADTKTYPVGASPVFTMNAQAGYELVGVSVEFNGQALSGTPVGNTFTLDANTYKMKDGEHYKVTAQFQEAKPAAEAYSVTVKLTGPAGSGTLQFASGAAGANNYTVDVNSQQPPVGSDAIMMPSKSGVYLDFLTSVNFKLSSLKINGDPITVIGSGYFLSVLTEDVLIEAVYAEGLPDTLESRTINFEVDGGNGTIDDSEGNKVTSGSLKVNYASTGTVAIRPDAGYMVNKALLWNLDESGNTVGDPTDMAAYVIQDSDELSNLQIRNVLQDMKLVVSFKAISTSITIGVDGLGGKVTPSGTVGLNEGAPITITITPDAADEAAGSLGYDLGSVTVNGVNINSYLTARNGGKYYTMKVVNATAMDPSFGNNPDGTTDKVYMVEGANATMTIKFDPVVPPAPEYVTITTQVKGDGGSITPTQRVAKGSPDPVAIWLFPDDGKKVKSVTLDGANVTSQLTDDGGKLTVLDTNGDHTVEVTFEDGDSPLSKKEKFTIHPSAGTGGSISPDKDTLVYKGQDQAFNFLPSTNYKFSKVFVDGVEDTSVPPTATSYTLTNVEADHNLAVSFTKSGTAGTEPDLYTVDVQVGEHGSANISGTTEVSRGGNLSICIFPDDGYHVDKIYAHSASATNAGGNLIGSYINGVFTLMDVNDNMVVSIEFAEGEDPNQPSTDPDNLIVLSNENIDADAAINLKPEVSGLKFYKAEGTNHANIDFAFTASLNSGYQLTEIKVNGKKITPTETGDGVYHFIIPKEEIRSDMLLEVHAQSEPPSTPVVNLKTITITTSGNGSVQPQGEVKGVMRVEMGASQTLYFLPDAGNRVDQVSIDGAQVQPEVITGTNGAFYTIPNVTEDMRVEVRFVEDPNAPAPPKTWNVTVKHDTSDADQRHGFASVSTAKVPNGGNISISFKPDAKYETHLYLGQDDTGKEVTGDIRNSTYYLENITADVNLFVKFTPIPQAVEYFKVKALSGDHGRVSPEGTMSVIGGTDMTFTFLGDDGYTVKEVYVTRGDVDTKVTYDEIKANNMTYKVENIHENVIVWAEFEPGSPSGSQITTYDVEAKVTGVGGTVSPTSVTAASGSDVTLSFAALRGYQLQSVKDGANDVTQAVKNANGVYVIKGISADHTVTASFEPNPSGNPEAHKYDVFLYAGVPDASGNLDSSVPAHGAISPSGVISVPAGGSVALSFMPDKGYKVSKIHTVIGGSVTSKDISGFTYTLFGVNAEQKVFVEFAELGPNESQPTTNYYHIQATSSVGGSISPSGDITVAEGGMSMYSFTPNDGYKLSYLVVDGDNVAASAIARGQYTFTGVIADHTIHAVFCSVEDDPADFVTVNAGMPAGGSISPAGAKLVLKGTSPQYNIAPFYGYTLADIRVDDQSIFDDGPDGTKNVTNVNTAQWRWDGAVLTLKNVQQDCGITAIFQQTPVDPDQPEVKYSQVTVNGGGSGSGGSISFNPGTTVIQALKDTEQLQVSIIPDEGWAIRSITVDGADGTKKQYMESELKDVWRQGFITLSAAQVNYSVTITVTFGLQTEDEKKEIENGTFTPAGWRTITAQAFGRGSITPHGAIKVANGAGADFSMIPMAGYELSGLHVDGGDAMGVLKANGSRTYHFNPGTGDHTIDATFSQVATEDKDVTYLVKTEIDAAAGAKGFASVDEMKVIAGGNATLYFWPEARDLDNGIDGSKLTGLTIINAEGETSFNYNIPEYVLTNVTSDTTVRAHFEVLGPDETTWTVDPVEMIASVSMDGGGSVSPAKAMVPAGCQQVFNLFPDSGNEVSYLRVNEEVVYVDGNIRTYSMMAQKRDDGLPNSLEVTYKNVGAEVSDVTVTAKVNVTVENGSVTKGNAEVWPASRTVPANTPVTFFVKPDPEYTISSISVDGRDLTFGKEYFGVDGESDHTNNGWKPSWDAAWQRVSATAETDAQQGGRFAGDAAASTQPALYTGGANLHAVNNGDTYYSMYKVTIVAANHDVEARVKMRKISELSTDGIYNYVTSSSHKITITSEGGGTVNPVGSGYVPEGEAENIRLRTFEGYYLESVICTTRDASGNAVKRDLTGDVVGNNLQVIMGDSDMEVHAKFTEVGTPSYVQVGLGSATYDGGPVNVVSSPALPGEFPRDVNGTSGGTQFFFTPLDPVTGQPAVGTHGRPLVLESVMYNGKPVPFVPDSNYVRVDLIASGEFELTFREIDEGHEVITPTTHTVTAEVVSGQGSVTSGPFPVTTGGSVTIGMTPDEGWLLDTTKVLDCYTDDDGAYQEVAVAPEKLADGTYTLTGVDRDHKIKVSFFRYIELDIGWTNGDNGYITPNTMAGQPLKRPAGQAQSFIVAPYESYDVASFTFGSTDATGSLRQSQATIDALLAIPGNEGFDVKNKTDGMGVQGPMHATSDEPFVLTPVSQAANPANGVSYAAAPRTAPGEAPALRNFNYAYGYTSGPINQDTDVRATWTEEQNVVKRDERTITVEILGGMGGTVEPMEAYGYDGDQVTFNFFPDDGWQVKVLSINGSNTFEYNGTSYTHTIDGDATIGVGFDSISSPGKNSIVDRILRTLRALAQTGDLTAPLMGGLLGVAVLAGVAAYLTARRGRRKQKQAHARR